MILRIAAPLPGHGMGIVETDQPFPVRPMQGQGIVETVRLLGRNRHAIDDEPDPIPAIRIDDEHLTVEIEKHVERRIPRPCRRMWLSY